MIKKAVVLLTIIIILTSCTKSNEKFYLNDEYYNQSNFIKVKSDNIPNKDNYILYTYNNYCNFAISCDTIFESFMQKYQISFLSIPFEDFKNTPYYKTVKYAPSIIVIQKGKIVTYLDAESDEDINKYQDLSEFEEWLSKYIYLTK